MARIRLSLNSASLSDYDPSYNEFTVGALAPSSQVSFTALQQTVAVQFTNGETAQHWQVPAAQAQSIRDRTGRNPTLTMLLRITGVQPGPGGGAILTEIEAYELHADDGTSLARVRVMPP